MLQFLLYWVKILFDIPQLKQNMIFIPPSVSRTATNDPLHNDPYGFLWVFRVYSRVNPSIFVRSKDILTKVLYLKEADILYQI
jgi:hypothetical protein